jgi:hypothetical protein
MAFITGQRNLITVEEMQTGSAAAENTMSKVGADLNLLLTEAPVIYSWCANGPYSTGGVPQTKVDGLRMVIDNLELCGYFLSVESFGTSGTLEVDILRITTGGSSASIFSTTPKLTSAATGNYVATDFRTNTQIYSPTGGTAGVASITNYSAGDKLQMNINNVQLGANGFSFQLFFRAR